MLGISSLGGTAAVLEDPSLRLLGPSRRRWLGPTMMVGWGWTPDFIHHGDDWRFTLSN